MASAQAPRRDGARPLGCTRKLITSPVGEQLWVIGTIRHCITTGMEAGNMCYAWGMKRYVVSVLALLVGSAAFAQSSTSTSFFDLARDGTAQQVQAAIRAGAHAEARDGNRLTPLMFAAAHNPDAAVVKLLLASGARVEDRDGLGDTALMWAAAGNSNPDVIKALLAAGAKVNDRNRDGETPLMWAAGVLGGTSNPAVIKVLLAAGAPVNERDRQGMTPLMHAAYGNSNPEVVAALLAAGADKKLASSDGKTAYDYAKENYGLKGASVLADLATGQG